MIGAPRNRPSNEVSESTTRRLRFSEFHGRRSFEQFNEPAGRSVSFDFNHVESGQFHVFFLGEQSTNPGRTVNAKLGQQGFPRKGRSVFQEFELQFHRVQNLRRSLPVL